MLRKSMRQRLDRTRVRNHLLGLRVMLVVTALALVAAAAFGDEQPFAARLVEGAFAVSAGVVVFGLGRAHEWARISAAALCSCIVLATIGLLVGEVQVPLLPGPALLLFFGAMSAHLWMPSTRRLFASARAAFEEREPAGSAAGPQHRRRP